MVSAMRNLTSGVFEHLDIIPPMDVDKRVAYMKRILIGDTLKKYKVVRLECKQ